MKRLLFLLVFLFVASIAAQNFGRVDSVIFLKGINYDTLIYPTQKIHFGNDSTEFVISWEKGTVDITYGKNTTPSEAMKEFWNWLKEYIRDEYYIIRKPKKDNALDILLEGK